MARINLLPWREERRQERQKQFYIALFMGFLFAVVILGFVIWYLDQFIEEQNARNDYLQKEIVILDRQIAEIRTLDDARNKLLARMNVIQSLQLSRPKVVKVFDALVRSVPEGIHLEKVTRHGEMLTLNGVAQSNARVSVFMQNLENNDEFEDPRLDVIQRTSTRDDAIRKFTLTTRETKMNTEEEM